MSFVFYILEFKPDDEFITCIKTYKNCYIFRQGGRSNKIKVYNSRVCSFVETEWEDIQHIIDHNHRWYVSHEKINKQTAYVIINKMKMAEVLSK